MGDSAKERFAALKEAFRTMQFDAASTREHLMSAYGLKLDSKVGNAVLAKRELEFAEQCLAGVGPESTAVGVSGDLRRVLLIEIGLFGNEDDDEYSTPSGPPWLLGDWIVMAKIIVNNARMQLGKGASYPSLDSTECVRLWPETFEGSMDDKVAGLGRMEFIREIYPDGNLSLSVKLVATSMEHSTAKWVLLPHGPSDCRRIYPDGVPSNLWQSRIQDPTPFKEA